MKRYAPSESERSATCPNRFTLRERAPAPLPHGWFEHCRESNPDSSGKKPRTELQNGCKYKQTVYETCIKLTLAIIYNQMITERHPQRDETEKSYKIQQRRHRLENRPT